MKFSQNQRGIVHPWLIVVIVVVLAGIGFAGWRVWEAREADKRAETPAAVQAGDQETTDATYVRPASKNYQVIPPNGWASATCDDVPNTLFLAPTENMLGKCDGSGYGGTVFIFGQEGNTGLGADSYLDPFYGNATHTNVTIDGIKGYKVAYTTATLRDTTSPPIGTKIVQYVLFDGTDTWTITYTQLSGDPDNSAAAEAVAQSFERIK